MTIRKNIHIVGKILLIIALLLHFQMQFENVMADEEQTAFEELNASEDFLLHGSGLKYGVNGIGTGGTDIYEGHVNEDADEGEELLFAVPYVSLVTSDEGINLIRKWEGCRLSAYQDLKGTWTIGYGHTGADVKEGMTISQEQAVALLKSDVAKFEGYVNNFCKNNNVTFTQSQFDAMVSFTYNVGTTWINDSTIRRYILDGITTHTDQEIIDAISMWSYSNHQFIQGLYNRRQEEGKLFVRDLDRGAEVGFVNLEVRGKIGLCFYVKMPESILSTAAKVEIRRGGEVASYSVSDGSLRDGMYMYSIAVPVRCIDENVAFCIKGANGEKLTIKNANNSENEYVYSVKDYLKIAESLSNEKLKTLVKALDAYSKSVKLYFGDISSADINQNVSLDASLVEEDRLSQRGDVEGVSRVGSSLILESDTCIRHYFALSQGKQLDDYTFYINNTVVSPVKKGNVYYIEITNIPASRLDERFTVLVKPKAGDGEYEFSYSAFSYIYSALTTQNVSDKLKTMCYYLYMYANAADEYMR